MPKVDTGLKADQVKSQLNEIMLPYKIDIVVYEDIQNRNLREHIDRVGLAFEEIG